MSPSTPTTDAIADEGLIDFDEVRSLLGGKVSRTTLWRLRRRRDFPEPIIISPGRKSWLKSECKAWIVKRAQARASL